MFDKLLTLSQACEIMHCSYSKGQKLAKSQQLPFKKLGATWVIGKRRLYEELGLSCPHEAGEPEEPG